MIVQDINCGELSGLYGNSLNFRGLNSDRLGGKINSINYAF